MIWHNIALLLAGIIWGFTLSSLHYTYRLRKLAKKLNQQWSAMIDEFEADWIGLFNETTKNIMKEMTTHSVWKEIPKKPSKYIN